MGVPQKWTVNDGLFHGNPLKMDGLGLPPFQETPHSVCPVSAKQMGCMLSVGEALAWKSLNLSDMLSMW